MGKRGVRQESQPRFSGRHVAVGAGSVWRRRAAGASCRGIDAATVERRDDTVSERIAVRRCRGSVRGPPQPSLPPAAHCLADLALSLTAAREPANRQRILPGGIFTNMTSAGELKTDDGTVVIWSMDKTGGCNPLDAALFPSISNPLSNGVMPASFQMRHATQGGDYNLHIYREGSGGVHGEFKTGAPPQPFSLSKGGTPITYKTRIGADQPNIMRMYNKYNQTSCNFSATQRSERRCAPTCVDYDKEGEALWINSVQWKWGNFINLDNTTAPPARTGFEIGVCTLVNITELDASMHFEVKLTLDLKAKPSPPPTPPPPPVDDDDGLSTGAVVGIACGGAAVVGAAGTIALRNKNKINNNDNNEEKKYQGIKGCASCCERAV